MLRSQARMGLVFAPGEEARGRQPVCPMPCHALEAERVPCAFLRDSQAYHGSILPGHRL